ncbi:TniQ family protein [Streptomyces sp. NPDC049910]|uniref:TniQ family protein n=1 Tax=Streptomyces sp. NPDC049910 TaxID=3155278 RepID=UPI003416C035
MSPRRLALVPDPYPGESLLSWADRARAAQPGLQDRGAAHGGSDQLQHGVGRVRLPRQRRCRACGEPEHRGEGQRLRSMTLAYYAGSALEPRPPDDAKEYGAWAAWRYRQRTMLPNHSNACPSCLRENGGRWLLKWRLIWSFACVRHQR